MLSLNSTKPLLINLYNLTNTNSKVYAVMLVVGIGKC